MCHGAADGVAAGRAAGTADVDGVEVGDVDDEEEVFEGAGQFGRITPGVHVGVGVVGGATVIVVGGGGGAVVVGGVDELASVDADVLVEACVDGASVVGADDVGFGFGVGAPISCLSGSGACLRPAR